MGRLRRRMFGSVRVRVALVAGLAFAIALVAGSVLLLHTLESRLVSDIRSADEGALLNQRVQLLTGGLAEPSFTTGATPVVGAGTVSYVVSNGGPTIVATAVAAGQATSSDAGPSNQTYVDASLAPPGAAGTAGAGGGVPSLFDSVLADQVAPGFFASTQTMVSGESARLLGVEQGNVLVSSLKLAPGLSLTTASSLSQVGATLSTTRTILWYAVPLLVLLVMGAAWLLVGRALRPVHSLTARAASINAQSLHERVPVSDVGDEVSELATTINSMLSRIEIADISSRRLVSDASHELRTPIAVMRTELEVARRNPDAKWNDVSSTVLGEVDRLQGLVDDLLLLARISERGAIAEPFSLLDTVRDVASAPTEHGRLDRDDEERR